ncbi:MAG: hypothetical protein M3304_09770 [Actinomycetota bacterium]|nr:hypothetical protein [Actinomycetota bacterium]
MTHEVVVSRGWGGGTIAVDERALGGFHVTFDAGGTGAILPRNTLAAYMLCTEIPDGAYFGHSCRHGPPPHRIKVLIFKSHNDPALYKRLRALAGS